MKTIFLILCSVISQTLYAQYTTEQYITVTKAGGGPYRVGLNGQAHGYIVGRDDAAVNKFVIDSDGPTFFNGGSVGIGTTAPGARLTVALPGYTGTPTHSALSFFSQSSNPNGPDLKPALEVSNNGGSGVGLVSIASNNYFSGRVGIGTTTPGSFKLAVNGKIWTQEVNVAMTNPGPDYVFEGDYDLISLVELEAYINQNKHLPEVPSAKEMDEEGLNLKEMNLILLKKVEELTLYLIEQEKGMRKMQNEIDNLKK